MRCKQKYVGISGRLCKGRAISLLLPPSCCLECLRDEWRLAATLDHEDESHTRRTTARKAQRLRGFGEAATTAPNSQLMGFLSHERCKHPPSSGVHVNHPERGVRTFQCNNTPQGLMSPILLVLLRTIWPWAFYLCWPNVTSLLRLPVQVAVQK